MVVPDAPWVGKCAEDYHDAPTQEEYYCRCDCCGAVIYCGEEYFQIGNDKICAVCVADAKTTAR